jgi:hypothetical protein
MPQLQLPVFPATAINPSWPLSGGRIRWFISMVIAGLRTPQDLAVSLFHHATHRETRQPGRDRQAFGVPLTTVKRCCRLYRERAVRFPKPPARRQGHQLTPEKLAEAQALLEEGKTAGDQRS